MLQRDTLVLDAMGVIYEVGDDVADLLGPFIREKGGCVDLGVIASAYTEASLGRISADEFWRKVGLSNSLEDEYLARHTLSAGLLELLHAAPAHVERVVCLSNDLTEWSKKLRELFALEPYFSGWYISSDIGLRKPDPAIYTHLLDNLRVDAAQVVFVDDRTRNLVPADELGIQTVHYDAAKTNHGGRHRTIHRLTELVGHDS